MEQVNLEIDACGRIQLPERVMSRLGLHPEDAVLLELTEVGALLRSKKNGGSLTELISSMNLPVSDWETMRQEIDSGRTLRPDD